VRSPAWCSGLRVRGRRKKSGSGRGKLDAAVLVELRIEEEGWRRRLTAVDRGAPAK
jgi:hypothetical protein